MNITINLSRYQFVVLTVLFGILIGLFTSRLVYSAGDTINGCIKVNGTLRILTGIDTCTSNETPISWSSGGGSTGVGPGDFLSTDLSNKGPLAWGWATYRNFRNFNFSNTNLGGPDFGYSDLSGANFSGASINGGGLSHVIAHGANFSGASLNGSYIGFGDFAGSDFSNANLSDLNAGTSGTNYVPMNGVINMANANFTNATLLNSHVLTVADFTGAIWSNTICPDGTNSDSNGNTCVGHL